MTDPTDPNTPLLMIGDFAPTLTSTIPEVLDTKTMSRTEMENNYTGVSCRHMFTINDVDFSYGVEGVSDRARRTVNMLDFAQRDPGLGMIFNENQSVPFLFGDPVPMEQTTRQHGLNGNAHLNALWRINKKFRVEGGALVFRYDDDAETRYTHTGPRAGIAWQVDDKDWLRVMARKDFALPGLASLAPTATVGLAHDMTYVTEGGRSTLYQARWDREWFTHLFTSLRLSCQDIHGFSISAADNSFETYDIDYGRINSLGLAVNVWIKGGIGLFADGVFRDTANRSHGIDGQPDLPMVPESEIKTGLAWVHPAQIRAVLMTSFIGNRPVNPAADDLDDYVTTDLALSWQPLDKHLELGISVTNLFDTDYDQATDMPGPGRVIGVNAKILF